MSNDIQKNQQIEQNADELAAKNNYPKAIEQYKILLERKKATNGA